MLFLDRRDERHQLLIRLDSIHIINITGKLFNRADQTVRDIA